MNKKRLRYIITAFIIVLVFILIRMWQTPEQTVDELLFDVPQMPASLSENDKIKFALDTFVLFAKKQSDKQSICKGGFLNTEEHKALKEVSNTIVSNRVINPYPLEFASTQDEAGVTCLSSQDRWVLFIPLNLEVENEPNYICADSLGRKGRYEIDRTRISCR